MSTELLAATPQVEAATGVTGLAWLLFVLPAFGALVLFLAGRRADAWGHVLGCLTVVASFVVGLTIFLHTLGLAPEQRTAELNLYRWIPANALQVGLRAADRPALADLRTC